MKGGEVGCVDEQPSEGSSHLTGSHNKAQNSEKAEVEGEEKSCGPVRSTWSSCRVCLACPRQHHLRAHQMAGSILLRVHLLYNYHSCAQMSDEVVTIAAFVQEGLHNLWFTYVAQILQHWVGAGLGPHAIPERGML